jgi:hypothetical protein
MTGLSMFLIWNSWPRIIEKQALLPGSNWDMMSVWNERKEAPDRYSTFRGFMFSSLAC